ncbi:hypothetical protein K4749_04360 [Streptomyces sp. TRM72054]|uniref:hypothetical protein n=1 Tax=Streptomyces sp. TRM72054 TaxID=2870562 RepID=UPI001C8BBD96|nr:hypothetical protein [Streptomyces sp. TRM72054]MBX9392839.1 hypothetical protein [Streptomyces sp. TRM72054]
MRKRIVTVLGTLTAAFMLAITPASARNQDPSDNITYDYPGLFEYTRSCGTSYALSVTSKKAVAAKGNNGRCAGHAWLRVMGDSLGKFRWAYIKGCADCYAYIVYP